MATTSSCAYKIAEFAYNPQKVNINTETATSIKKLGGAEYFLFQPSVKTTYILETSGNCDTYMYLYNSEGDIISYNDDAGENYNSKITYSFKNNENYYIKIKLYSNSSIGDFIFNIKYSTNIIEPYSSITVNLNEGENAFFEFSVPHTIDIDVITEGDKDTYLYLYDANFNLLDVDNDSAERLNAKVTYCIEEGQTYYVRAHFYNSIESGSFSVLLKLADGIIQDD